MKILFEHMGSYQWIAGQFQLEGFFSALRSLGNDTPHIGLAVEENTPKSDYQNLLPYVDQVFTIPPIPFFSIQHKLLRYRAIWWLRSRILNKYLPLDPSYKLSGMLKKYNYDLYFTASGLWIPVSVPIMAWIFDFQHLHLPDMFTPQQRAERDQLFYNQAQLATIVLPDSKEVGKDFKRFAPNYATKVRDFQFVAHIPPTVYDREPQEVLSTYHLPEKFFYLPNQFWKHKNHKAVFEALRILKERAVRPYIVCTGNMIDARHPTYFVDLVQKLSRWDIRNQVIILGIVPREHVFMLMRQAICVLNPSLFEGLGMSVAECKSLGKRVILSDLPVLREQDPPCPIYFDPTDANDLADKMEMVWETIEPGPDLDLETVARAALLQRQQQFGRDFLSIAHEVIALSK